MTMKSKTDLIFWFEPLEEPEVADTKTEPIKSALTIQNLVLTLRLSPKKGIKNVF